MTQSASTSQRVMQLSSLLQNPATVLPVFVRFQQTGKYLTIPVIDVVLNEETVEIKTVDGSMHSINLQSLLDVVAFRDGSGKAVFLTEFPTGGDLAKEYRDQIEVWDRVEAEKQSKRRFINPVEEINEFNIDLEIGGVYDRIAA